MEREEPVPGFELDLPALQPGTDPSQALRRLRSNILILNAYR